ncbi:Ig-like domain repeat protein [Bacillus sp. FJAT-29953]|nr:Ig-like domain repeat protein [Bacillus sp. FJAT-29953]
MFTKRKSRATRILAVILAILLVAYNIPASAIMPVFAETTTDTADTGTDQTAATGGATTESGEQTQTTSQDPTIPVESIEQGGTTETGTPTDPPETATYQVSVKATAGGTIKINDANYTDPVQVQTGTNVAIEITPEPNYEIQSVKIAGVLQSVTDKGNYTSTIPSISADTTIEVVFVLKTYTIAFNYKSNEGTVKDENNQTINSQGGTVNIQHGNESFFTVTPLTGFHVESIYLDGTNLDLATAVTLIEPDSYKYTFTNVTANHNVQVQFAINTYAVTASVNGGNGDVKLDIPTVGYNGEATATMTPNADYRVASITINGTPVNLAADENFKENEDGTYSYTVKNIIEPKLIEVTYEKIPTLDGTWSQYVSITLTSGSLIDSYKEGGKEIRVYSKDAVVKVAPIGSYNLINLQTSASSSKKWQTEYTFNKSTSIKDMKVKIAGTKKSEQTVNLPGDILLVFDKQGPAIKEPALDGKNKTTINSVQWFSDTVTVSGEIENGTENFDGVAYSTPIKTVLYSKVGDPVDAAVEATFDAKTNRYSFGPVEKGQYKIWAVDQAGNQSAEKLININIDQTNPTLADGKAVKVKQINYDTWSQVLNILTFGMFFNKGIQVTVDAKDGESGVKAITLYAKSVNSTNKKKVPLVSETFSKDIRTAEAVFLLDDESFEGTFSVEVTDNVNNKQNYDVNDTNVDPEGNGHFIIDRNAPTAELTVASEKNPYVVDNIEFYSGDAKLNIKAEDLESGVNTVTINLNDKKYKEYDFSQEKQVSPAIEAIDTSTLNQENRLYDFSVTVKDNAGNKTDAAPKKIFIDEHAPVLADGEAVTFAVINDSTIAKVLNYLSFGTFFNKKLEVTVKVKDDASGIKDLKLKAVPENAGEEAPTLTRESFEKLGLTAEASYTLDVDRFKGTFQVEVTDNVNNENQTPYLINSSNSNIKAKDSGVVMIEKTAPAAAINVTAKEGVSSYVADDTKEFYNGEVTYDVDVQDADSGVNTVKINVNDQPIDEYFYHEEPMVQHRPDLAATDTGDSRITRNEDGSYHIAVGTVDNAGNAAQVEKTIFIDETSPMITDFHFSTDDRQEDATESLTDAVELTEYGFFFKKPIRVTVKAEDPVIGFEATSEVKSMVLYLQDYENGKFYAVLADGSLQGIAPTEVNSIAAVPTTGEFSFNVPAAFKGQIFAKATDHVNNTSAFATPDGTVIEDEAQHAKESHIALEKVDTSYRDNQGLELYANNVNVKLTVTDTYSGLSQVEWSVVAPYDTANNQGGRLQLNNNGSFADGSNPDGWQVAKTDKNLVTEMTKTITVSNNSNAIVVKAKVTDRAGNTSEKELTFSIDKTAPQIKVTYDNNSADQDYPDFYKADRTATVVVTERNFNPKDVEHLITNTDGAVPSLVGWSTAANSADPDKTTHTATVKFSADGDYTFDIKYKDNAGNAAPAVAQQKFTIDKTIPVVKVSYSNNSAANGNYYRASRTATISINEHNFDAGRVKVTGTASDNSAAAAFPKVSGWSSKGDIHTATIQYAVDGKYSFDIDFTDKAGNIAADYKAEEFIVDQTAPELTITGVKDQSANNGDVIPVITYSDTNFNQKAVSIKLTGANHGPAALDGSYADAPNGQVFTFKNFEKKKEIDDLYTLTATLVDFAGNETSKTIRFSVNRFGSVYVFDDALKAIEGKYVQKETDVIVTETNVDSLKADTIQVKMTKNGTPSDLAEGKDYTVTETGGAGQWSQYKYVVKKSLFTGDGKYTVALYSEDAAGNINENIDEKKQAEISFGIDKTAPVIVPIDIESGEQYPVDVKKVTVSVKDNLVLKGAEIYLNGKKVEHEAEGENYTFDIQSLNSKQNVKIIAVDAAGNELSKKVNGILVSTNPIVRWYNNKTLFMGSIGGVGSLAAVITALVLVRKRKTYGTETIEK